MISNFPIPSMSSIEKIMCTSLLIYSEFYLMVFIPNVFLETLSYVFIDVFIDISDVDDNADDRRRNKYYKH